MLNVRSLLRKYDDVIELCRDRRNDLLRLTETWHDADSAGRSAQTTLRVYQQTASYDVHLDAA